MRTVAILCAAKVSPYKQLPGVDVYDIDRDVRTFAGGMPVVAHPPCRSWSSHCAHQAKPPAGEKDLGPLCVDWVRECGGVLEHPAHSRLWQYCGLPLPGERSDGLFTLQVSQAWWGYSMRSAEFRAKRSKSLFDYMRAGLIVVVSRSCPSDSERRPFRNLRSG